MMSFSTGKRKKSGKRIKYWLSNYVFKRPFLQRRQKSLLCGKGLISKKMYVSLLIDHYNSFFIIITTVRKKIQGKKMNMPFPLLTTRSRRQQGRNIYAPFYTASITSPHPDTKGKMNIA